jgi:DNA repair ATPase RecN
VDDEGNARVVKKTLVENEEYDRELKDYESNLKKHQERLQRYNERAAELKQREEQYKLIKRFCKNDMTPDAAIERLKGFLKVNKNPAQLLKELDFLENTVKPAYADYLNWIAKTK